MFTLNVELSPFVKVKFLVPLLNDAVINEDAVMDEDTNPNAVICAEEDIVPAGIVPPPPPKEDVDTVVVLPLALPTHTYPCCNEAVKLPDKNKSPAVFTSIPIEFPYPSCKVVKEGVATLSVPK